MRRKRGGIVPVSGMRLAGDGWSLRIGMRLNSPNRLRNSHWSADHRDRQAWSDAIENALIVAADVRTWAAYRKLRAPALKTRMRLLVTREVPHRRNFIKDRDNLIYSCKRLRDALKGRGLIYDDSMAWLDFPDPKQEVSEDGLSWTVITVQPVAEESDVCDTESADPVQERQADRQRRQRAVRGGDVRPRAVHAGARQRAR
jgi:dTDP-4-dehydrorhamnose 3,5-epimerase-like enzyme